MHIKNQKAFTLIELLVTVMIIAVLAGIVLSLINTTGIRSKSRDGTRVADLKKIQVALELYFADTRNYPSSASSWNIPGSSSVLVPNYISSMPADPLSTGSDPNPCQANGTYRYRYRTDAGGSRYVLTAIMEVPTSAAASACSSLYNWNNPVGNVLGCGTAINCYGVQNP